ncbi:hypothetical protein SprV_0301240600 [Sparganum proliferum]
MFLERLPADVQSILASGSEDFSVLRLAETADRMMEVQRLSLILNIGLHRSFSWVFVIVDVSRAILCSDFLPEFDLLVDCRRARLLVRTTALSVRGLTPFTTSCNLSVLDTCTACLHQELLLQHPNITYLQFHSGDVQHDIVHHIRTSDPPVFARPRRLAVDRFQAAKAEFEHMPQHRIIRPFERPWASTLHMVPKRFIDHVLRGLPFVYAYTDDILVATQNEEEHKEHLAMVFDRIDKFGVITNPSKRVLGVPSLELLGRHFDSEGLRPLPSKVEAIRDFPPLTSKRQLQRFLGIVDFYRRLLPNCADLILPLTNMLSGPKGPLELTVEALTAFEKIKNSLADANLLTHPPPEAQPSMMVDASTVAVGAIPPHHLAGSTRPLALFLQEALVG